MMCYLLSYFSGAVLCLFIAQSQSAREAFWAVTNKTLITFTSNEASCFHEHQKSC